MSVRLERMSAATAAALLEGKRPPDILVAEDYPSEFSQGVAAQVANGSDLGPYVIYAAPGRCIGVRWNAARQSFCPN